MSKKKYVQMYDGDWAEPNPQVGHKMACCDCGLVHTINFRIVKGKVQFQAIRDKRATSYRRKKMIKQIQLTDAASPQWDIKPDNNLRTSKDRVLTITHIPNK